ncbi:hypothetical protein TESG_01055 [Trichophyton tonsurans CBS 112818]|uniref:Uncharacterized protein n=1 Tax=Trichophyton tonsurans (strain CBS 112818) TaxID=647933 RepID=F2RPJ6_TRIT1|nr:hypothetical protein TESG_01055 [Trichophyton tonsurans CBS 112818]
MYARASASVSARQRILNPFAEGAGSRVYPPTNSRLEKSIGLRLDKGEKVHNKPGFLRLKLQINKGADDPTLRKLANEDSHRVIATIDIDTNQEANEENLVKFFGDIEGNVTL